MAAQLALANQHVCDDNPAAALIAFERSIQEAPTAAAYAGRAAPVVAALKRADGDRVCLPPVAKLEAAALAQADAARARVEINQ